MWEKIIKKRATEKKGNFVNSCIFFHILIPRFSLFAPQTLKKIKLLSIVLFRVILQLKFEKSLNTFLYL